MACWLVGLSKVILTKKIIFCYHLFGRAEHWNLFGFDISKISFPFIFMISISFVNSKCLLGECENKNAWFIAIFLVTSSKANLKRFDTWILPLSNMCCHSKAFYCFLGWPRILKNATMPLILTWGCPCCNKCKIMANFVTFFIFFLATPFAI